MKKAFFDNEKSVAKEKTDNGAQGVKDVLRRLDGAKFSLLGEMGRSVDFIKKEQVKDRALWAKFVHQFRIRDDVKDAGWRGEYWGKMMRGACVVYTLDQDEELYEILQETVKEILTTQDWLGRISTYSPEREFFGWDIWCRKYVMIGMSYFYDICKDEAFKKEILKSVCAQADYMIRRIGKGEGKIAITETSTAWGCVNSCSILEEIVWLYQATGKDTYLDFANYLIETGGCKNGNLIETALENIKKPHEYPSKKAYEVTSFFNGVLGMYRLTGKIEYLQAVQNFVKSVQTHDLTIIGCCGCDEETFDNSALSQTEFKNIMQETCVTVTWMQICYELLCLTGDINYANCIEQSAYNAMYSSINYPMNKDVYFLPDDNTERIPLPFDSYSPLVNNRRGIVPGGYRPLSDGTYYGCCACIGSLGLGLVPLTGVMQSEKGFVFHIYETGTVDTVWRDRKVRFAMQTAYPQGDSVKICVATDGEPIDMQIKLRIPDWSVQTECYKNGEACGRIENGYFFLDGAFENGDELTLTYRAELQAIPLNRKVALKKGVIVMARDERFGEAIEEKVALQLKDGKPVWEETENTAFQAKETLAVACENGKVIHVCDYASAGMDWKNEKNKITVWLNCEGE